MFLVKISIMLLATNIPVAFISMACQMFAYALYIPANAYYATKMEAGYVTLEAIPAGKSIPANTAVLISSSQSSLTFEQSDASPADVRGNILSGTLTDEYKENGYDYFVLSGDSTTSQTPSFAKYQGSRLSANRAYIMVRQ